MPSRAASRRSEGGLELHAARRFKGNAELGELVLEFCIRLAVSDHDDVVDAKDGGAFFALAAHSHRVAVDLFDVGLVEDVHAVHAQPLDFVEPALVCKELLGGLIRFIDEVDLARSGVEMGDDAERAADVFGGVADAPGAAPFIVRLQVVLSSIHCAVARVLRMISTPSSTSSRSCTLRSSAIELRP